MIRLFSSAQTLKTDFCYFGAYHKKKKPIQLFPSWKSTVSHFIFITKEEFFMNGHQENNSDAMNITLYSAMIDDDYITSIVKEKEFPYHQSVIQTPQSVVDMMNCLFDLKHCAEENLYLLALTTKMRPIGVFHLSRGTIDCALINPREVFLKALFCGASHIILVHNHPSKWVEPSNADTSVTKQIKDAGTLLNIPLDDHIIIGGNDYFSFKENNLL